MSRFSLLFDIIKKGNEAHCMQVMRIEIIKLLCGTLQFKLPHRKKIVSMFN